MRRDCFHWARAHGQSSHVLFLIMPLAGILQTVPWFVGAGLHAVNHISSNHWISLWRLPGILLTCLELSNLKLNSFIQLHNVIVACPGLKRLYMDTVTQHHEGSEPPNTEPLVLPYPPLLTLKMIGCDLNEELFNLLILCQTSL